MVDPERTGTEQGTYYDIFLEWHIPVDWGTGLTVWDDHYAFNLIGHLQRNGTRRSVRFHLVTHCGTIEEMRRRVQYLRGCICEEEKISMLEELAVLVWTTESLDVAVSRKLVEMIDRSSEINSEDKGRFNAIVWSDDPERQKDALSVTQRIKFSELEYEAVSFVMKQPTDHIVKPSQNDPFHIFNGNILQYLYQTHGPEDGSTDSPSDADIGDRHKEIYPAMSIWDWEKSRDFCAMEEFARRFPGVMGVAEQTENGFNVSKCDHIIAERIRQYILRTS